MLERATRDHPQRVPVDKLKRLSGQLAAALPRIEDAMTTEELRGIEGEAAKLYFDGFDDLILQQRPDFAFAGRSRRPPLDPVNALLSFAYTLLARDCAAALEGVGLDPYVGFLHRARPGRTSLALDLMEELRAVCADRFVLTCNQPENRWAQTLHKAGKRRCPADRRRPPRVFAGMAAAQTANALASLFGREAPLGAGALCAGAAVGPHAARRPGRIPAVFLEVRCNAHAGFGFI